MFKYKTVRFNRPHGKYPCNHAERVECITDVLLSWGWNYLPPDRYGRVLFGFRDATICFGKRMIILRSIEDPHRGKKIEWQSMRGVMAMRSLLERIEAFAYRLD